MAGSKTMWVAPEFHKLVNELAKREMDLLRLKKKPSSVTITRKLAYELTNPKPFRARLFR